MRSNSLTVFIKIDLGSECHFDQSAEDDYSRLVANDLTRVGLATRLTRSAMRWEARLKSLHYLKPEPR